MLSIYFEETNDRILYTPSLFAKENLLYLQETGSLIAKEKHTNSRSGLDSFLFFIVNSGSGNLTQMGKNSKLERGYCSFINCKYPYSHTTDFNFWELKWVHFFGTNMNNIYEKYISRGGKTTFLTTNNLEYNALLDEIYKIASSQSYIRDMQINEKLNQLITLLMSESIHNNKNQNYVTKKDQIEKIKEFLSDNYMETFTLDDISKKFFINKFYLCREFKDRYGITINTYTQQLKITTAKKMLRFTNLSIELIAEKCCFYDVNYFCRIFKKIEGTTPGKFRRMWESNSD